MAVLGLRIYDLTDTQASYDPDLYMAVDDAGFSNTKKIKISTIYPKTDTLTAAGAFNSSTSTLRLGNGSNVENKIVVDDFLANTGVVATLKTTLGLDVSALSFSGTADTGITVSAINGNRNEKLQIISGRIAVAAGTPPIGTESFIRTIDDYTTPGYEVPVVFQCTTNINESASGRIDVTGNIYITAFKESTWIFTTPILGL